MNESDLATDNLDDKIRGAKFYRAGYCFPLLDWCSHELCFRMIKFAEDNKEAVKEFEDCRRAVDAILTRTQTKH